MSYFFNDDANQNEIYENEFYYNLGLEFPLSKKVYSYTNKVSYSKEKKIWFIRYKKNDTYFYLFGYNYGTDRQLDTKDPLLILKFNLFNAPNLSNSHFAVDNTTNEVRAVMNIQYKNYHSQHKSENLKSISPIVVESNNYLDLGNIYDSKELCENIEILLDEIESIFFFNRYLNRIKNNAPIKYEAEKEKQTVPTFEIKKEENISTENTKENVVETPSEVILEPAAKTVNCDFCGSEILEEDPFKICKACRIRISNYLDLLCADFEINSKIPLETFLLKAQENDLSRKNIGDITKTLNKYKYLHKIDGEVQIDYNDELRNFIDEYTTKTENKNDNIENNVILVAEKIGLNTPFDIPYLKEALGFKNSEISRMIKYLDENNAIIQNDEYYILVDKTNEINGINDNIIDNYKSKDETGTLEQKITNETNIESNIEYKSNDEKLKFESTQEHEDSENNPLEKSDETTIELKPINTKNKTDIEIFYESYEKVLTFIKQDIELEEIAANLGISENRLNAWIDKGKTGKNPYRLLSEGIKKINETPMPQINVHKWKKILEDTKAGYGIFEVASRANIPYPVLQFHLTKGKQGKEGFKEYYDEYQHALKIHDQEEIKTRKRCQICNEILSNESKVICESCESKKKFAVDLKILMEKLKYKTQFSNKDLSVYYSDNEILELNNNLKQYNLILENSTMYFNYLRRDNVEKFLNTYFDAKNPNYKIKSKKIKDSVHNKIKTKQPKKILLAESKNTPYPFTGLNENHTFSRPSGSSSKFTLEDVMLIHKNYYENLYSVEKIAKKMGLSQLTIKKLIVRYDAGDFDKFIEILEKENKLKNISICESCGKKFEPIENEEYCKDCLISSRDIGKNKFNIILQTEPEILIGTVTDKDFANELCSIGTAELSNNINFEDIIDNLQEIIAEKRREEIREIINDGEKSFKINQKPPIEDETEFIKSNETTYSKIKVITSFKKELLNGNYTKLRFMGELPNDKIDSSIMDLLNKFKATKRELRLIPLNENVSKIIFNLVTKNSQTTTNMEILRKNNWHFKIKK